MTEARYRARVAALIGCAAFGVHEARYLLAYGDLSGEELARQGHAYLPFAGALAIGLLALAAVQLLAALTRARRTGDGPAARPAFCRLWLAAGAALLAVHVGQELAEGALAAGHPHGLAAVFADGGWVCVPLALGFGAIVALCLRGAELAVIAAARRARLPRPARRPASVPRPSSPSLVRTSSPLASKLAGRAPPLTA
jgi:hypothetical protein